MRTAATHDAALAAGGRRPARLKTLVVPGLPNPSAFGGSARARPLDAQIRAARRALAGAWLLLVAAIVALAVAGISYVAVTAAGGEAPARLAAPGTAFLGTTTCRDWRRADVAGRLTIVRMLGLAATGPDPETAGSTLEPGRAYGLFQRACSTELARSFLLYEIYNRAASFQSPQASPAARSGAFARP
jgi:hypothetical protein